MRRLSLFCILFWSAVVFADSFNRLENINYSALPGNSVQISLEFSGKAPANPPSFSTDNPARIVLDFPNTNLGLAKKFQNIGVGAVQGTTVAETSNKTRVVLNLVRSVPFNTRVVDNKVLITVENTPPTSTSPASRSPLASVAKPRSEPAATPVPVLESQGGANIQNIDFHRTEAGAGRIIITLSDPSVVVDMREEGKNIVLDLKNTGLPERFDRRLDVIDFATPITFIDTFQEGSNVRMNITTKGDAEHLGYQSENTYVIEVKEPPKADTPEASLRKKEPNYTGQRVSFNFQNIDIRAALLLLTDLPGVNLNVVIAPNITGTMSLRLKNTPWDQALDIILNANALGMKRLGNVLMIDTKANMDKREKEELEAQQAIKKVEPLRTEFIQINYAKAEKFVALLKSSAAEKGHSFLSERGSVSFEERTNALIIQDTAERIADIRALIARLDTPARQVLIDSKVVIASNDFSDSLGVKFGYSANRDLGSGYGAVFGGKAPGDVTYSGGTAFNSGNTSFGSSGGGGSGGAAGSENYLVNLPGVMGGFQGSFPAAGLAIGKIGSYLLQLELSALEVEGKGEIISSPRLITANQMKATILQGQDIAVPGVAGVGATAAPTFKQALLQLEVTPQITPDDRVIMDLMVTKNEPSGTTGSISRREVKTQVLVDNGETVVLGGVYEQTKSNTIERVPFLGDLPLVGNLFKRRSTQDNQRELLIFVTPKIIKQTT